MPDICDSAGTLELGYNAYFVKGYVKSRNGGREEHGWVEIVKGGQTYICDLIFQQSVGNGYVIRISCSFHKNKKMQPQALTAAVFSFKIPLHLILR